MRIRSLHDWDLSTREAVALQKRLARKVRGAPLDRDVRLVAGIDCGYSRTEDALHAAVVLCRLPARGARRPEEVETLEEHVVRARPGMPYVPGLLSFREAPAALACLRRLSRRPGAVLVDGQGRAHPRRLGLASHIGLFLGLPAVGCAKSVLVGEFRAPGARRGARARMRHRGEVVGLALRTRERVNPVYVSIGHLADLEGAARLVLRACAGFRLPEPIRRAHNLAARARLSSSM